jgi:hypothetical protein
MTLTLLLDVEFITNDTSFVTNDPSLSGEFITNDTSFVTDDIDPSFGCWVAESAGHLSIDMLNFFSWTEFDATSRIIYGSAILNDCSIKRPLLIL